MKNIKISKYEKCVFIFSDNSRKDDLEKVGFFKIYEESIFPLILFEISVMEKIFLSQIFQKV